MSEDLTMTVKILELAGKRWAVMPEKDYKKLAAQAQAGGKWPALPKPDAQGNYPAVEYARVSLARKIIKARRLAGTPALRLQDPQEPEGICRLP
jgi:hypothetical protein